MGIGSVTADFIGIGTLVNASTVLIGGTLGLLLGHRFPERTQRVVTDGLGLVTLVIAGTTAAAVTSVALEDAVGAPLLVVLAAVLLGGIAGSLLRLEDRLEQLGDWLHGLTGARLDAGPDVAPDADPDADPDLGERARFIDGFVTSSLVFCVGPLTVLGSISEGLGEGPDQLLLKAGLDGFAAIAFTAAFGWGVLASVVTILLVQGGLTGLGAVLGDFLPTAHVDALTATGGVLLFAVALRLLQLRVMPLRVADLLPALVFAPVVVQLVVVLR